MKKIGFFVVFLLRVLGWGCLVKDQAFLKVRFLVTDEGLNSGEEFS